MTDPDVVAALEAARELIRAGMPVFLAAANPATALGVSIPEGWPASPLDLTVVDRWQPGDALCAVGGNALDAVDDDPRNGGDVAALYAAGVMPRVYAVAETPSGGTHHFIATLGVRKVPNLRPGIDLQAGIDGDGHGFVFIAPTIRRSKVDGVARPYRWRVAPDAEHIRTEAPHDDSGAALAEMARARQPERQVVPDGSGPGQTEFEDDGLGDSAMPYAVALRTMHTVIDEFRDMDPERASGFDAALNRAAFIVGKYIGSTTDYADAYAMLYEAAGHNGCITRVGPKEYRPMGSAVVRMKIHRGLSAGAKRPNSVGPREPRDDSEDALSDDPAMGGASERPSRRIDLGPYLDGSYVPPTASVGGELVGSRRLLYPGRWHTMIGTTGSGKSWWATWHVVEELRRGHTVAYAHFEESSPAMTLDRLRGMAPELTVADITERFIWLDCTTSWSTPAEFAGALPAEVSLVVLDGINAAATQHASDPSAPEAVAKYRRMFVTPATTRGAAVLSLGHPPKARDRQDERHSFGSTAWLDEVDGIGFRIVAAGKPIRRGHEGAADVYSVKDRGGSVEQFGQSDQGGRREGWMYLGRFHLDSSADRSNTVGWMTTPPLAEVVPAGPEPLERLGEDVVKTVERLVSAGVRATRNAVCGQVKARKQDVLTAITDLQLAGRLRVTGVTLEIVPDWGENDGLGD